MVDAALFSSDVKDWETPQAFFDELNKEFRFRVDVCANKKNAKCKLFYSSGALEKTWPDRAWMNPPYGDQIYDWVAKAYSENLKGKTIVCLLPVRTDTKWFHNFIYKNPRAEIRFVKGRLKFGGAKNTAPFPNMVVVFRGKI